MKTLTGSCLKIFSCKYREKGIWCPRDVFLGRPETGFFEHRKNVDVRFSLSVSLKRQTTYSIFAASALSKSDSQTLVENEEEKLIKYELDQPKTVHVRFKLQKECRFGQQILIVGDDPIFGFWDPSDAVPLHWSDGHVWNVELDIPSGTLLKYKFILKGDTETNLWQPGPDRILETWEKGKTITVFEDWDDPQLQKITDEELITDQDDESILNSELLMVAQNMTQLKESDGIDASQMEKPVTEKPPAMVAESITEENEEPGFDASEKLSSLGSIACSKINEENSLSSEDEASLVSDEGVPVLVPGLILMPEEASVHEVEKMNVPNTLVECEGAKEFNVTA
ncbi:Carbohydrate-binding-like fold [Forsythia ovata]|uniref:Carbohydrate-binding-like fold n=1 Tax=Forsythia ovata TaxID=205694 RepID=A0ABD1TBG5_9LAMI